MKIKFVRIRWLAWLVLTTFNALPFTLVGQPVTFAASTYNTYTYNGTLCVAVADINGDGKPDLISAKTAWPIHSRC